MTKLSPSRWALWSLPRPVLLYIALVEFAALAVVATTATVAPITGRALMWFAMLVAGMVAHLEVSRHIERIREIAAEGRPHTHPQDVWLFAGVLLLPPLLAAAVIVISYGYAWLRVYQRRPPLHRKVFSAATVILACWTASLVLSIPAPDRGARAPLIASIDGAHGLGILLAAILLYFVTNIGLVVTVILLVNPNQRGRIALGHLTDHLIILGALGLGSGVALVMILRPGLLPVLMLTMLALHVGLLLPQFQTASRTDSKTGLVNSVFWHEMAAREPARARGTRDSLGVLILDLDHFKNVNDRYGHLVGDQVIRAVADAMKREVRSYDLIGRFGGEEFVVLVPDTSPDALRALAERLRLAISTLTVTSRAMTGGDVTIRDLTASVGAALYPDTAADLSSLLMAADAALYSAKTNGRDQTRLAPDTSAAIPHSRQPDRSDRPAHLGQRPPWPA